MPLSVTNTFSNLTTADAVQVNQNFTDILNILSDGTKALSVNTLALAGAGVFNGAVTLGASTSNLITVNGSINSSIPINTNTTYDFGSATKGLLSVYLGGTSTFTGRIIAPTLSGSVTYTMPTASDTMVGRATTDTLSNKSWTVNTQTGNYTTLLSDNLVESNANGGATTITLLSAAAAGSSGLIQTIKKVDTSANTVTINTTSAQTIEGRASGSIVLTLPYDYIKVQSNGANWDLLAAKITKYLTATSSNFAFSGTATATYPTMSGNSVSLTPGHWTVSGYCVLFIGSTGSTQYISGGGFYAANGGNSASVPTALTGTAGNIAFVTNTGAAVGFNPANAVVQTANLMFDIYVTANTSVFLVPQISYTTAGNAAIISVISATERW